MNTNKFEGQQQQTFSNLLTCLQCSDNDFGVGDVSTDVFYEPGGKVNLIKVMFSR